MLVMAGTAWAADIQATPTFSNTPGNANCTLHAPDTQCGSWTYWMAVGAIILGVLLLAAFVIAYFRFAPRFQVQEPAGGRVAGAAGAGATRPLARPEPAAARPAAAPAAAPGVSGAVAESASAPTAATAVAVAEPPPTEAAAPATAGAPEAPRPPSPRHDPVEPDQETYDRVLAEQLAKGTDRRVADGRAKAAALKAAREKAAG
jgi:hypothetical protein